LRHEQEHDFDLSAFLVSDEETARVGSKADLPSGPTYRVTEGNAKHLDRLDGIRR
jgi:hypothetical protein